ncbi:MAG: SDR family NAD(P)-dependent oxidoreductase [Candidatus Latescibacteria bacterium]|nr:SDR family NAD(P)-dependent oxidoreductase [Candidatus Latescibacterota bacterium]
MFWLLGVVLALVWLLQKNVFSEGAIVVIAGRNEKRLKEAIKSVGNPKLKYIVWDVGDIASHDSKFKTALELLNVSLDILVNNAGIHNNTRFQIVTSEVWDKVYRINSKGLFFLSQVVVKHWLVSKHKGKIVNISSSGGFVGATYPYRMSKWDVAGLTRGLGNKFDITWYYREWYSTWINSYAHDGKRSSRQFICKSLSSKF